MFIKKGDLKAGCAIEISRLVCWVSRFYPSFLSLGMALNKGLKFTLLQFYTIVHNIFIPTKNTEL